MRGRPPPYLAQYLQLVGSFFFNFSSRPLLVRLRSLQGVFIFRLGGGGGNWDVRTWTGRDIGDCVVFLFPFVLDFPFLVRARYFLMLSRRVRSLHCSLIDIVGALDVVVPAVVAWPSPG